MNFITLTSDMGHHDYYVGAMKGYIYKKLPDAKIVDISHTIKTFDILGAAFCISNIVNDFPDNSIHIIAVNAEPKIDINIPSDKDEWPMVMRFKNQYFIGIDNGLFSLILKGDKAQEFYRVTDLISSPNIMRFPAKNILANIACQIASGINISEIGELVENCKFASDLVPVTETNLIRGHVIHVDIYGNLISNISETLFQEIGKGEPFTIYFRSKEYYIDKIHSTYGDVPAGDRVAIFNSNGLLEIAINMGVPKNGGGANSLFGLKERDIIRIEFTPRGSKETIDSLF